MRPNFWSKVLFTTVSVPMFYNTVWAWKWQARRKIEKQELIDQRISNMKEEPREIKSFQSDVPLSQMEKKEFDKQWLYKPIKVTGIFDHEQEVYVTRTIKGEQGIEVVTPLFMNINDRTGHLEGILVNRGRLPLDYKDMTLHHTPAGQKEEVVGLIFYSEGSGE